MSYDADGVKIVKDALVKAEAKGKGVTDIRYLGAGKFKIIVKSSDYKDAEKILESVVNTAVAYAQKNHAEAGFVRSKAKG